MLAIAYCPLGDVYTFTGRYDEAAAVRQRQRARRRQRRSGISQPQRADVLSRAATRLDAGIRLIGVLASYLINARSKIRAQASCTMPR